MNFQVELLQDFNLNNPNQGVLDPNFNKTVANLIRLLTTSKTRYGAVYSYNYDVTETTLKNHSLGGTIITSDTVNSVTKVTEAFSTLSEIFIAPYFNAFDGTKDITDTLEALYSKSNKVEEQFQLLKHDISTATYLDLTHFEPSPFDTFTTYGYFALVTNSNQPDKTYLGIIDTETSTLSILTLVPLSRYLNFNNYRWMSDELDPYSEYWNESINTGLHQDSMDKWSSEEIKRMGITKPTQVSRSYFLDDPVRGTYFWLEDALNFASNQAGIAMDDLIKL